MNKTSHIIFLKITGFLLLSLLTTSMVEAQDEPGSRNAPDKLEQEHSLSMEFETPHTKWAKPFAFGKTRVLFFTDQEQGSTNAREIIELMQRFDLDANSVYLVVSNHRLLGDGNPQWYKDPKAGTNRALNLLKTPYDTYFFNKVNLGHLPDTLQQIIRKRVLEGAGIVMIGESDSLLIAQGHTVESARIPEATVRSFGKGNSNGIFLKQRERLSYGPEWETMLDYQMELQGRAILVAAHKSTLPVVIRLKSNVLKREELPGSPFEIEMDSLAVAAAVNVYLTAKDGTKTLLRTVKGPKTTETAVLPVVPAGNYHIDVQVLNKEGVLGWSTKTLSVSAESAIDSIQLSKDWGEVDEEIQGTISCSGETGPKHKLSIRLIDREGRILSNQSVPLSGHQGKFSFHIEPWMPMLLRVEALLSDPKGEVSLSGKYCRVVKRHRGEFNFVVWGSPSGDLSPYGIRSLEQNGSTAILQGGNPPLELSACEQAYLPYTTRICANSHSISLMLDTTGVLKGGCMHDEAAMDKYVKSVVDYYKKSREHGVLAYSLGDENAVRASCLSPYCLKAYQDYLKVQYGNIGSLNSEWGTNYNEFGEVNLSNEAMPGADAPEWFRIYYNQWLKIRQTDNELTSPKQITLGDINDELVALKNGNFARWYDRQAFQSYTYVELCKKFLRAFKKMDPKAITGFEGTDSFTLRKWTTRTRQGGDLDAFVRELEYFGPYQGPANEVVRSIAPKDFPCGNWIGYSQMADDLLYRYWDQITSGMNTIQWWRWDNVEDYIGFLSPNFAPYPATKELLEDTRIVRDGLGSLLMKCDMEIDSIAMLYSMPSTHIAHFDGNQTYGDLDRDHRLWYESIHDAGLQFSYVTDRMLRLGEFDASKYKVLILPLSFAIGDKEAWVIRDFVNKGGTVIADVRPGIYDGHCKPLEKGSLDEMFGIKRDARQDATGVDRLEIKGQVQGEKISLKWGNWYGEDIYPKMVVDQSVHLTTGHELGKAFPVHYSGGLNTPLCIVNQYGKGRAILLNFPIFNAQAGSLIKHLILSAGVKPLTVISKPDGSAVKNLKITRWKNGNTDILSLFGKYGGKVRVSLDRNYHITELKTGKYLGDIDKFTTDAVADRALFYSLIPSGLPELSIKVPGVTWCGEAVKLILEVRGAQGLHALRLSLKNPRGEKADWFKQTLNVGKESKAVPLVFALNDMAGEWHIEATDILTGKNRSVPIILKNKQ